MQKKTLEMFFLGPQESVAKVALNHGGCTLITFIIFVNHVTIFNSSPMQHVRWSSLREKIDNGWKLLLTVVT